MPTFTLRITGNATMTKTAEQAKLCVASSSDGPNKQAVCDQVLTTARYIEDILQTAQAQNAVSHWTQTSLSIETWIEHISRHLAHGQDIVGNSSGASSFGGSLFGNNPLGLDSRDADIVPVHRYRARIVFDVCFQDFNILSQFKSHLTSVDHCVMLSGPDWNLPPHAEERLKSQLRMEAAQDASSKVADYCRVVCPGQDDIVIVPTELHSEHITGGSVPVPSKLDQPQGTLFSTGKPDRFPSQTTLGGGKGSLLLSSIPGYKTDLGCTPQEIRMALSVDFVFTVDTKGFKLSTTLDGTSQSAKLEA